MARSGPRVPVRPAFATTVIKALAANRKHIVLDHYIEIALADPGNLYGHIQRVFRFIDLDRRSPALIVAGGNGRPGWH